MRDILESYSLDSNRTSLDYWLLANNMFWFACNIDVKKAILDMLWNNDALCRWNQY